MKAAASASHVEVAFSPARWLPAQVSAGTGAPAPPVVVGAGQILGMDIVMSLPW